MAPTKKSQQLNHNLLSAGILQPYGVNAVYDWRILPITAAVSLNKQWLLDFQYVYWRLVEDERLGELPSWLRTVDIEVIFRRGITIDRDPRLRLTKAGHTFNLASHNAQFFVAAALIQSSHDSIITVSGKHCDHCMKGNGPWAECAVMWLQPDGSGFFDDYRFFGGACMNCNYQKGAARCNHCMRSCKRLSGYPYRTLTFRQG